MAVPEPDASLKPLAGGNAQGTSATRPPVHCAHGARRQETARGGCRQHAPRAFGARRVLFEGPFKIDVMHPNYDVYPDGSGFVMLRTSDESRRLVVELNWVAKLRQKLRDAK